MKTIRFHRFSGLFALGFSFCFFLVSCSKHSYPLNNSSLVQLAKSAREPGYESFVVYDNLDTLRGIDLDQKRKKGMKSWYLDGKEVEMGRVLNFQDKYAFYERGYGAITYLSNYTYIERGPGKIISGNNYTRILKGKLSLFYHQVNEPGSMTMKTVGSTTTSFYMGNAGEIKLISLNSLKNKMLDCHQAIQKIDEEFDKTYWKKHFRDEGINDYKALLNIFNVYNNCN